MSGFLQHLAATPLAVWVGQSSGYPLLLVLHSIGLALLVGMLAVIDLCVLGSGAASIPTRALRTVMRIGWSGMFLAAASGALLFLADGARYYYSATFRFKLISIALGLWLAYALSERIVTAHSHPGALVYISMPARILAACSLVCWLSAIMAGRLMAYIN
jgi:hypothetical protein